MSDDREKKDANVTWRDILRFAAHYVRPNWRLGATAALFMLVSTAVDALVPVYTGMIVDATTGGQGAVAFRAFWIYMGLALMHQALRIASIAAWNRFAARNLHAIVNDGLRRVQRFSSDWHANTFAGGTVRKITRGMWAFDAFEDTIIMSLLPAITIMISMTAMLAIKVPAIGAAAGVIILVYCLISIWMSVKILAPRFTASAETDTKVGATLADIITGNPTVKAFAAETREDALFLSVTNTWREKSLHAWQTGMWADAVRTGLRVAMTGGMVGAAVWLWSQGRATPGDITLVLTAFMMIGGYLRNIGQDIAHLQRSISDMEDAVAFWLRRDEVADAKDAKPLVVAQGDRPDLIAFRDVAFKYPASDRPIYEGMNVTIAAGETLALVGASGSGKSTFVKLIQRLYDVTEGEVLIDGQNIAGVTMESLRRSIALVPQDPVLFHRSLSENIAYGRPDASREEIVEAAKQAFAHDFIATLPKGYDTLVGERGVKLSGGERQRVAIARAILADAPILIFDEATSSLDSISEHYIQQALETLMKGRTTITIAHRLSTIQRADRILVFDKGRIIEQGRHAELMARPSQYKALYDMQALGIAA